MCAITTKECKNFRAEHTPPTTPKAFFFFSSVILTLSLGGGVNNNLFTFYKYSA